MSDDTPGGTSRDTPDERSTIRDHRDRGDHHDERERPSHPVAKANLLMLAVVLLLVAIAVASAIG